MNSSVSTSSPGWFSDMLQSLRPYPGRGNLMLRCLIASSLVMIISLSLQVPFLALSLISVFYVTQKNVVLSTLTGILFVGGATLAVTLAILNLKLTWAYPLPRLLLSGALLFGCAWMMRASKYGVMFFLSGIVIIYTQTFADLTDNADSVVRLILWLWVSITYAIVVTLVINLIFIPQEPVAQLRGALNAQMSETIARLEALIHGQTLAPQPASVVQDKLLTLQQMLAFSIMRDKRYREDEAWHLARISTVSGLYMMAQGLPETLNAEQQARAVDLLADCKIFHNTLVSDSQPQMTGRTTGTETPDVIYRMHEALQAFSHYQRDSRDIAPAKPSAKVQSLMNGVWSKSALKTLLSTMVCYLIYLAADWQGIHTIMLSCLIVSQASLGATVQRGLLRVIGAAAGSLIALLMVILVMPHIDGIVGLMGMSLPVIALGAWIYAGSEKISYVGIQLMFTFSLALLETFGPTFELVEIRDRIIGILLGVLIATLFHIFLWPEREGQLFRDSLQQLLKALAARMTAASPEAGSEIGLRKALAGCQGIAARVAMEPGWATDKSQSENEIFNAQRVLSHLSEIIYQLEHLNAGHGEQSSSEQRQQAAEQLLACADAVAAPSSSAIIPSQALPLNGPVRPLLYEIDALTRSLTPDKAFTGNHS